jgi:phosphate:Na+ symporter
VGAALFALPSARLLVALVRRLVGPRERLPEPSHLERGLLDRPEDALAAVIRELRRVTQLSRESLDNVAYVLLLEDSERRARRIRRNEQVIDQIKIALREYLLALSRRRLSRRQAMLMQHLNRCMIDLERIGDHIDKIREVSADRRRGLVVLVDRNVLEGLFELHERARGVLALVAGSLDAETTRFQNLARRILAARDDYVEASHDVQEIVRDALEEQRISSLAGVLMSEYVASLDRIVRHARSIALVESQSRFRLKPRKFGRVEPPADEPNVHPDADTRDVLERFHREEPL